MHGDCSIAEIHETRIPDPEVVEMMQRLTFREEPAFTAQFPAHRYCRAVIHTRDGRMLVSPECEPRGEAAEKIGIPWLSDKFRRITAPIFTREGQERILAMITGAEDLPVREIVREMNRPEYRIEL